MLHPPNVVCELYANAPQVKLSAPLLHVPGSRWSGFLHRRCDLHAPGKIQAHRAE